MLNRGNSSVRRKQWREKLILYWVIFSKKKKLTFDFFNVTFFWERICKGTFKDICGGSVWTKSIVIWLDHGGVKNIIFLQPFRLGHVSRKDKFFSEDLFIKIKCISMNPTQSGRFIKDVFFNPLVCIILYFCLLMYFGCFYAFAVCFSSFVLYLTIKITIWKINK